MKKVFSILAGITGAVFYSKVLLAGVAPGFAAFEAMNGQGNNSGKGNNISFTASVNGSTGSFFGAETSGTVTTITPDIKANGQDGPITISTSDNLSVTVSLNAGGNTNRADWWALAQTSSGSWYHYNLGSGSFQPGSSVTYTGPLFDLGNYQVLNMSGLPQGTYILSFSVDLTPDGSQTTGSGQWYSDSVVVNVGNTTTTPTPTPTPAPTSDPALIGTWNVISLGGQPPSGTETITMTPTTFTYNRSGCQVSGPYSVSGSTITATFTNVSSGCSVLTGVVFTTQYTLTGSILNMTNNPGGKGPVILSQTTATPTPTPVPTGSSSLIGAWSHNTVPTVFTFTSSTFINVEASCTWGGSYTATANSFTLTIQHVSTGCAGNTEVPNVGATVTAKYSISADGNTLTMSGSDGSNPTPYTRI